MSNANSSRRGWEEVAGAAVEKVEGEWTCLDEEEDEEAEAEATVEEWWRGCCRHVIKLTTRRDATRPLAGPRLPLPPLLQHPAKRPSPLLFPPQQLIIIIPPTPPLRTRESPLVAAGSTTFSTRAPCQALVTVVALVPSIDVPRRPHNPPCPGFRHVARGAAPQR